MRHAPSKYVIGSIALLVLLSLFFAAVIGASLVTHRGEDVTVTYDGQQTNAQLAISSLWMTVKDGSTQLWNKCVLYGSSPSLFAADDVNNLPASVEGLLAPGHHGKQILVNLEGVSMSANNAILGIATQLEYVRTHKVKYPCHSYCLGNKKMDAGVCNDAGSCGSGFGTSGTECGAGAWCKLIAGEADSAFVDTVRDATCVAIESDRCDGTQLKKGFSCGSDYADSCDYATVVDCADSQQRCDGATLTCVNYCGNGRCDSGESQQSCSQDCGAPPGPAPLAQDELCGPQSENADRQCSSGLVCTDTNGDGIGACRAPTTTTADQGAPFVCGDGFCDANEVGWCTNDCDPSSY